MLYVTRHDFVRTLWKPSLGMVSSLIGAGLFGVAESAAPAAFVLCIVLLFVPRLNGFIPQSRAMGYFVYGSSLCLFAFGWLQWKGSGNPNFYVAVFGVGLAAACYAWVCQYLMWVASWNCYAPSHSRFALRLTMLAFILGMIFVRSSNALYAEEAAIVGAYHFACVFILCLIAFHRQAIELALEPIVWILYSIRRTGRTAYQLPPAGPLLIVANHSSWFDPIFLAKVLPRPITPMMTSRFYDIWFLRPLLKYVFKVIVVPDVRLRREAPELQLAIAALDRGEVVVIFPEGALRRKEEVPLKRFGQGVHMILRERPETPVISCWIEGAWGSYFSYFNGPPTKNKRMDFRREIRVAMSEPETVPEDVLADQLPTRIYLMNRVLAARELLILPALPKFELPASDEKEAAEI